jgi:hypothetical protein
MTWACRHRNERSQKLLQESEMTDECLNSALRQRGAVVVHFSHIANMGRNVVFPSDLQEAIKNKDAWSLSCSALWPGHAMQLCGSVGVIFKPTVESVLSVYDDDAGSSSGGDGSDRSSGWRLSKEALERSFCVVGAYNEWRVRGAEVVGIFVHDIRDIWVKKMTDIAGVAGAPRVQAIGEVSVTLSDVFDAFGDMPVYTMDSSGLIRLDRPPQAASRELKA